MARNENVSFTLSTPLRPPARSPPQGWQGPGVEPLQAASLALGATANPFEKNVPFPRQGRTV